MARESNKMKSFALKYLLVLVTVAFGFLGGVLYTVRDRVPIQELESCQTEVAELTKDFDECKGKFMQCVIFLNGVLEGKGVKK
jgi:hypothetical protein